MFLLRRPSAVSSASVFGIQLLRHLRRSRAARGVEARRVGLRDGGGVSGCATRPRRHKRTRDVLGFWRAQLASGFFGICGGRARRVASSHAASGCATDAARRAAPHGRVGARARAIVLALVVTVFGFWRARLASGFFGICGGRARRVASSHAASGCAADAARRAAPHGRVGARALAIVLALVVTVSSLCADALGRPPRED